MSLNPQPPFTRPPDDARRRLIWQWTMVAVVVLLGLVVSYVREPLAVAPAGPQPPSVGSARPTGGREAPQQDAPEIEASTARATRGRSREQADPVPPSVAPPALNGDATTLQSVSIRDERGRLVYRGSVDLAPTLKRIDEGQRLPFRHDGIVFENREGRLPKRPRGYYREYVHPTPDLSGPGPQRVVVGESHEVYYTPDHYRSFRRIR